MANSLSRALRGDGSHAPSPAGARGLDGSPVPLGSTAPHDPATLPGGVAGEAGTDENRITMTIKDVE